MEKSKLRFKIVKLEERIAPSSANFPPGRAARLTTPRSHHLEVPCEVRQTDSGSCASKSGSPRRSSPPRPPPSRSTLGRPTRRRRRSPRPTPLATSRRGSRTTRPRRRSPTASPAESPSFARSERSLTDEADNKAFQDREAGGADRPGDR